MKLACFMCYSRMHLYKKLEVHCEAQDKKIPGTHTCMLCMDTSVRLGWASIQSLFEISYLVLCDCLRWYKNHPMHASIHDHNQHHYWVSYATDHACVQSPFRHFDHMWCSWSSGWDVHLQNLVGLGVTVQLWWPSLNEAISGVSCNFGCTCFVALWHNSHLPLLQS